ncbi:hypothetical protein [Legionella jordanis]|uniref:Uncharacterized protein n=1 Tax=Legionella jordanis TaxID=456 RepID=A0A0W0VB04_9GAMM|nr:hypothetical protein [Legionella jordanis]KTD17280.1 hypothetical protein Ljor_1586 [Legionella jordanis]RMW99476.1 hypothetical protein EAW55_13815 [Legionella jordanis]RMX15326.1 hypothetical protein EAS68_12660 [Legionella jordanis]VEH12521.1 Uncharacterised protein [Legionella jordanis]HAT8715336.1 hypothetical protein [Legionella jordanis]
MKKIILAALITTAMTAVAEDTAPIQKVRNNWAVEHFKKQNMLYPDGGVQIVPEKKMSSYSQFKKELEKDKNDISKYGYINQPSERAQHLLSIKTIAEHQMKKQNNDYDPRSTHMRHSIGDLKMAYTFVGVPSNDISEFIGVAPYLTYLKGQGWVGAIQFFKNNDVGYCAFSENNIRLSHGSVVIAKEAVRNDVNEKITTVDVTGNKQTGFVYNVEWYDNTFFRQLECANLEYSQTITDEVIELAKRIDKNV